MLRTHRETLNQVVLAGIKELPYSEDLLTLTQEDAEEGYMNGPFPLEELDLSTINLTRRIPVRELRSKGWRTRPVDHATESMVNDATRPADRVQHDTVNGLEGIVLAFFPP